MGILLVCTHVWEHVINVCTCTYTAIDYKHACVNTHGCCIHIEALTCPHALFAHVLTCGFYVSCVPVCMCEHSTAPADRLAWGIRGPMGTCVRVHGERVTVCSRCVQSTACVCISGVGDV